MTTHPSQGTGYARVANKITNYLADIPGVEVVYYGFQNYKGQEIKDRFINPKIKFYDAVELDPDSPMGFGDKSIVPAITTEKPDMLFIYNDISTACAIMALIPDKYMPPKKVLYADIVYPYEDISLYDKLKSYNFDKIWTFLDFWKNHLINDIGFSCDLVDVLSHGIDFECFVDIPQDEAKKKLGFDSDDFLFINMNRNSIRKELTINITAFLELLKRQNMNPKIKMLFGCLLNFEDGIDIRKVVKNECARLDLDAKMILNNHIFITNNAFRMTDEQVNTVYNAGDVGINTGRGEGFGLTTLEHIYFNRPQVVSSLPALKETVGKYAWFVKPRVTKQSGNEEKHGGIVYFCDSDDFTNAFEYYFKNREDKPNAREYIKKRYNWENVYKVLDAYFIKEK